MPKTRTETPTIKCLNCPDSRATERIAGIPLCSPCGDAEADRLARAAWDAAGGEAGVERPLSEWWDAKRETEYVAGRLRADAASLGRRMTELAAALGGERPGVRPEWQGPTGASVNSLGEVQGRGLDIDRACALLDVARRAQARALNAWTVASGIYEPIR